jgi:hypothetical protein
VGRLALRDVYVAIGGVDASNSAHDLSVEFSREEIDVTPLGSPYREFMPGLEQGVFTFDLFAGNPALHTALQAAFDAGTGVLIEVRPHSSPVDAANPAHSARCLVARYTPLSGQPGSAAAASVELHSLDLPLVIGGLVAADGTATAGGGTATAGSTASGGLFPSISLYPSATLYPSSGGTGSLTAAGGLATAAGGDATVTGSGGTPYPGTSLYPSTGLYPGP